MSADFEYYKNQVGSSEPVVYEYPFKAVFVALAFLTWAPLFLDSVSTFYGWAKFRVAESGLVFGPIVAIYGPVVAGVVMVLSDLLPFFLLVGWLKVYSRFGNGWLLFATQGAILIGVYAVRFPVVVSNLRVDGLIG